MTCSSIKKCLTLWLCASLSALTAQPVHNLNPASAQWDDPNFVKEFIASYGFLADYEPQISNPERALLRKLIEQIKESPASAIEQLAGQIKPSSSASFDFNLGNLYFQNNQLPQAAAAYRKAIEKHPDFRRAYKNLGLLLIQDEQLQAAIPILSKAIELGEVNGQTYGLLGYAHSYQEQYYPAEIAYRQAILMQPTVNNWKAGLAYCLRSTQRNPEAIALLESLLKDQPDNSEYWLSQADAYLEISQYSAALRNFEIVRLMGQAQPATLTKLGDIYLYIQAPQLALQAYLDAIEIAKLPDRHALVRAAELLTQNQNFSLAQTLIEQTRSHYQQLLPVADHYKLLALEAKIAREHADAPRELAALNHLIAYDALNGDALIQLANYYAQHDDLPRAITRFQQAEKIQAHQRPALIARAQALVSHNLYKDALPLLKLALQLKADDSLQDYLLRVEDFLQQVERASRM